MRTSCDLKLPTSSPNHHGTTTSSSSGRFPDSRLREPSGSLRNLESTPPGKIQKLCDHSPPCSNSTVRLSADSVEQQEENNPFDTPERQASHHGTGIDAPLPGTRLSGRNRVRGGRGRPIRIRQWLGGRRSIGYFLWRRFARCWWCCFNCVLINRAYSLKLIRQLSMTLNRRR